MLIPPATFLTSQSPQPDGSVPYSGRLTDEAGQPVADGNYDFSFDLYAAKTGGEPLWSENQAKVALQGGDFTVQLGSVVPLAVKDASWLAVAVRGPGESAFSALEPRQQVERSAGAASAAPFAAPAAPQALSCSHTHFGEDWTSGNPGYGLRIENTGSGAGLDVRIASMGNAISAYSQSGTGLHAVSNGGNAGFPAIFAWNTNTTNGMAATMTNNSSLPTALVNNSSTGVVLNLQNGGTADGTGGGDFITALNVDATDTQFRLTSNGGVMTDAGFRCGDGAPGCLATGSADVAERVNASQTLLPGDVVEIDPDSPDTFRLASCPYSPLLAGVISSDPAIIMNVQGISLDGDRLVDDRPPLALLGRVPVKVSAAKRPDPDRRSAGGFLHTWGCHPRRQPACRHDPGQSAAASGFRQRPHPGAGHAPVGEAAMKKRTILLLTIIVLLFVSSPALAQSTAARYPHGSAPVLRYTLTTLALQRQAVARGGGYRLLAPSKPAGTGTPCCCNYLPLIRR